MALPSFSLLGGHFGLGVFLSVHQWFLPLPFVINPAAVLITNLLLKGWACSYFRIPSSLWVLQVFLLVQSLQLQQSNLHILMVEAGVVDLCRSVSLTLGVQLDKVDFADGSEDFRIGVLRINRAFV